MELGDIGLLPWCCVDVLLGMGAVYQEISGWGIPICVRFYLFIFVLYVNISYHCPLCAFLNAFMFWMDELKS